MGHSEEDLHEDQVNLQEEHWDDVTGKTLDPEGVKVARREEIDEYHKHEVYEQVDERECYERTGKPPIPVRWIDINKGGSVNPE